MDATRTPSRAQTSPWSEPIKAQCIRFCNLVQLRRRRAAGLGLLGKLPRIAVLLKLGDDVIGDGEALLLCQALLKAVIAVDGGFPDR